MARYYPRPENALNKAMEFIEVGKATRGLEILEHVIQARRNRAFSEKVMEPIMLKFLELCVQLKQARKAKEGLYQYKILCQTVNVGLLEKAIRTYLRMAEEKTDAIRQSVKKDVAEAELAEPVDVIAEVEDLDEVSFPEMMLLNEINEKEAQERNDKAVLIPWVKFLWESYNHSLELLRNNARLENLYHDVATMAFKFCLNYHRKTEFRRVSDRVRKHFDDVLMKRGFVTNIDFSLPETQQLNMETRLAQLDAAITLELWQEAYRAIVDIHLLMNQSKRSQTRMMAYYYQKLSLVFWKSGNLLFHAATLLKYYLLCKDMKKNISSEELQKHASQVVLATLAIPFPAVHPELELFVLTEKEVMAKSQKLSTLLFLPRPPTRLSLIQDLIRHGVLSSALQPVQDLHDVLEVQFNPLDLCSQVDGILKSLATFESTTSHHEMYSEPLQEVALVCLIKQISQVYQNIDYKHLLDMAVFATPMQFEQLLVDAVRNNDMQIEIDHRSNCIKFGSSLADASREDVLDGPHLQIMPSEAVRLQLVNALNCLEDTIEMINPPHIQAEEDAMRSTIVKYYLQTEKENHTAMLSRQRLVLARRDELERSATEKENEEKWKLEQMLKQKAQAEARRLKLENEEREKRRLQNEMQKIAQIRLLDCINKMKNSPLGLKVCSNLDENELSQIDIDTVLEKQQMEMAKETKEHQARMRYQEKRADHWERAKRQEEVPLLKSHFEGKKEEEKTEWEAHEQLRIVHLKDDRAKAVATRDRMKRMKEDKNTFLANLLASRRSQYVQNVQKFEEDLVRIKTQRLAERKEQRRADREGQYRIEMEEQERIRQEELDRLEEERRKKEEEKRKKEEEEQARELEERNRLTLLKQIAKQKELEERLEQERLRPAPKTTPTATPPVEPWRPPSRTKAEKPHGGSRSPEKWASKKLAELKLRESTGSPVDGGGNKEKDRVEDRALKDQNVGVYRPPKDRHRSGNDKGLERDDRKGFERGSERDGRRDFERNDRGFERNDRWSERDDRNGIERDDRNQFGRDDRGFGRSDRGFERDDRKGFDGDDRKGSGRDDRGFGRQDDRGFERENRRGFDLERNDRGFERESRNMEDDNWRRPVKKDVKPTDSGDN